MHTALLSVFPPFRGGIATFGQHLFENLSRHTAVTPINFAVQYPGFIFPGKTQFLEQSQTTGVRIAHPLHPVLWAKVVKEVERIGASHLLYAYWHPFFAPMFGQITKKCRQKGIVTAGLFHNVQAHDKFPLQNLLLQTMLRHTDRAFTLSGQTGEELRVLKFPRNHIHELFHPVDIPENLKVNLPNRLVRQSGRFRLVHYGLIRPYKGVDILLRALDLIPQWWNYLDVVLAGENYMGDAVLFKGISDDTRRHVVYENRFLSDEEAWSVLGSADYVVLPYRSASQSGVLAQAIGARKPVIISDLPGLSQYIQEGKTGWKFKPEDAEELSKLLFSIQSGELVADEAALEFAAGRYGWNSFARKVFECLH
jgi:glycosyltransferase involved in cell wall biosynthesis